MKFRKVNKRSKRNWNDWKLNINTMYTYSLIPSLYKRVGTYATCPNAEQVLESWSHSMEQHFSWTHVPNNIVYNSMRTACGEEFTIITCVMTVMSVLTFYVHENYKILNFSLTTCLLCKAMSIRGWMPRSSKLHHA